MLIRISRSLRKPKILQAQRQKNDVFFQTQNSNNYQLHFDQMKLAGQAPQFHGLRGILRDFDFASRFGKSSLCADSKPISACSSIS